MDGFRRQNNRISNDRSTMEERKEFFRRLGLPRHDVYDYAVRSFEAPAFDLDYFEYRRHNLQKQNLSDFFINKQLLIEVFDALKGSSSSSQQFSFNSGNNFQSSSSTNFSNFSSSLSLPSLMTGSNFNNQSSGYGNNNSNFVDSSRFGSTNNSMNQNQDWLKGNSLANNFQQQNFNRNQTPTLMGQGSSINRQAPSMQSSYWPQKPQQSNWNQNNSMASSQLGTAFMQNQQYGNNNINNRSYNGRGQVLDNSYNSNNYNSRSVIPNNQSFNMAPNNFEQQNEPNLEDQVGEIVVQALQHISNKIGGINQSIQKSRLPAGKKTQEDELNPFEKERNKEFQSQFKKFDNYILLTKNLPPQEFVDVDAAVKAFLAKKRPIDKSNKPPAAKRLKQDNEQQQNAKADNESNAIVEDSTETKDEEEDTIEEDQCEKERHMLPKRKKRKNNSLFARKVQTFTKTEFKDRPQEFIKPEIYGDNISLIHKPPKISKFEYLKCKKEFSLIQNQLKNVTDTDPSLKRIFFFDFSVRRAVNNQRIQECAQTIEKALQVTDQNLLYKESYAFLKARAIYNEFLYVFKKRYFSHDGLRTLQKIYDLLLHVDVVVYYNGILKMWTEANANRAKEPKSRALLADKAFRWLVHLAVKELKLLHANKSLVQRLSALYRFVSFTYEKDFVKAKILYNGCQYAYKDIHKLHELLEEQPEINFLNAKEFMSQELRVLNNDYNRFIETDAAEERKIVLEQLKTNPYVEKVHIYVANKMLAIYERVAYLESVHPRMISREDLKQLIFCRKFLATNNLKMFTKYILDKWRKQYDKFSDPKYKEYFSQNLQRYNVAVNEKQCDDDNDNDNAATADAGDGDDKKKLDDTLNEEDMKVFDEIIDELGNEIEKTENENDEPNENEQVDEMDKLEGENDEANGDETEERVDSAENEEEVIDLLSDDEDEQ